MGDFLRGVGEMNWPIFFWGLAFWVCVANPDIVVAIGVGLVFLVGLPWGIGHLIFLFTDWERLGEMLAADLMVSPYLLGILFLAVRESKTGVSGMKPI